MSNEKWVNIEGFNGKYQVSDLGNVRAIYKSKPSKILKPQKSWDYLCVNLYFAPYKFKSIKIHRLVAKHFLNNEKNYRIINHKNGNKHDNRVSNLEWCTHSENSKHSFIIGTQCNKGSNHPRSKINEEIVLSIKKDLKNGMKNIDIAKKYGCHRDTISQIKRCKQWVHVKLTN